MTGLHNKHDDIPANMMRHNPDKGKEFQPKAYVAAQMCHTWANRQRLIVALGEWHQEECSEINKSLLASFTNVCFKRVRMSANSDAVTKT